LVPTSLNCHFMYIVELLKEYMGSFDMYCKSESLSG
jgi:hypothetical protein